MSVISRTPCAISCSASATIDSRPPRAELAAQLRDDAEAARMVAALGDLDVGRRARRGEDARRRFVVEILRQRMQSRPAHCRGEKRPDAFARIAFGAAALRAVLVLLDGESDRPAQRRPIRATRLRRPFRVRRWRRARQNVERRQRWSRRSRCGRLLRRPLSSQPRRFQDRLQLAGADDRVDFGNVAADLVAVALHEAAGDDQLAALCRHSHLVPRHLQDRVDRLLLGRVDEAACVDDQNLGVLGRAVSRPPARSSRPIITSESTRFFGQPSETNPTEGAAGGELCFTCSL